MGKTADHVIEILVFLLGPCEREKRFPWALGDTSPKTGRAALLPFDAVWECPKLIIEIDEDQHDESTPFFDKRNALTVSGVHRGDQRRIYDDRKRALAEKHGYKLVRLPWSRRRKPAKNDVAEVRALLENAGVALDSDMMSKTQVEALLRGALSDLEKHDAYLLSIRANERSITHRLAIHLERRLDEIAPGWDVDCEYNRDGADPKRLYMQAERIARHATAVDLVQDEQGRTVIPDIIVHKRGKGGPNVLVIEVKREGSFPADIDLDREKLRELRYQLHYEHAYLVLLGPSGSRFERTELDDCDAGA